jgi:hypothetical protein
MEERERERERGRARESERERARESKRERDEGGGEKLGGVCVREKVVALIPCLDLLINTLSYSKYERNTAEQEWELAALDIQY